MLGVSTIGFVLLIFFFLMREGVPILREVPLDNLVSEEWYPTYGFFGALPLILGSLLVTVVAILIGLPLGVATAVYVREVAPEWAREVLKPMIEVLAGIPSVVLGFFATLGGAPGATGAERPTGLTASAGWCSAMALAPSVSPRMPWMRCQHRDGAWRWCHALATIWRVVAPRRVPASSRRCAGNGPRHRRDDGRQ